MNYQKDRAEQIIGGCDTLADDACREDRKRDFYMVLSHALIGAVKGLVTERDRLRMVIAGMNEEMECLSSQPQETR